MLARGEGDEQQPSTHGEDNKGFQASTRDAVNTNVTSGLVLHLAAYCDDMGCARRAESLLRALGDAGIVAQQDAGEKRSLRFGDAKRPRDDVFRVGLEREQPRKGSKALIARHARARHDT